MKKKNFFLFFILFAFFCITGCSTAIPYSFAENESETATITFVGEKNVGVDLHFYESTELPLPEKNKYWAPVTFPAGKPFSMTVIVYYFEFEKGRDKVFNCPALTAGKEYKLSLEVIQEKYSFFGTKKSDRQDKLVLKDARTGKMIYEQIL